MAALRPLLGTLAKSDAQMACLPRLPPMAPGSLANTNGGVTGLSTISMGQRTHIIATRTGRAASGILQIHQTAAFRALTGFNHREVCVHMPYVRVALPVAPGKLMRLLGAGGGHVGFQKVLSGIVGAHLFQRIIAVRVITRRPGASVLAKGGLVRKGRVILPSPAGLASVL